MPLIKKISLCSLNVNISNCYTAFTMDFEKFASKPRNIKKPTKY